MKHNADIQVYNYVANGQATNPIRGFHVDHTTYLQWADGTMEPHRHPDFRITLILSGETTLYVDFEQYKVKAPALILLSPDQIYQHSGDSLCETVSITFDKEFLRGEALGGLICWECLFHQPVIQLTDAQLKELLVFTKLMLKEARTEQCLREVIVRNLLNALMAACARLPQRNLASMQADTVRNRIVRQFQELSDQHYKEKTQVTHYADMMYVTPGHLNDTIKSAIGKTAKQVIDEKRITEAKRLLFWGEHSIKEIAWQLNFEDDGYFNRFFKKHTGQTPAMFQKDIREKYN